MEKKRKSTRGGTREYRVTHYSKRERQRRWTRRAKVVGEEHRVGEWKRVSRKRWTVNRSPHGHKTAREQFGRDRWERKRALAPGARGLGGRREKRVRVRGGRGRERRVVEKGRGCGVD